MPQSGFLPVCHPHRVDQRQQEFPWQQAGGRAVCAGAAWGGRGGGLAPQQPSGLPAAGRLRVVVAPAGAAGLSLAGRAPLAGVQRG